MLLNEFLKKIIIMANKRKKRQKRGHPIAILIGLHDSDAVFWRIFSETTRHLSKINRSRKRKYQNTKSLYHFHEEIINTLRPIIREGIRSVILLSPPKEEYSDELLNHINKHHSWLLKKGDNQVIFSKVIGNQAKTQKDVYYLKNQEDFEAIVNQTSNREALLILDELKELINRNEKFSKILYTWKEIDYELRQLARNPNRPKLDYIILTDEYLKNPRKRNNTHRVLQTAKNLEIKTKIVKIESEAGTIVENFGGIIGFLKDYS
jgi:stalled ribosome rescue protein Dom34